MGKAHVSRTIKFSYSMDTRGAATEPVAMPDGDEMVELDLGDGLSLYTAGGENLQAQVDYQTTQRDTLPLLTLRSDAPAQRGAVELVVKGLKVIGVDVEEWLGIDAIKNYAADKIAAKTALLADTRQIVGRDGGPGLYQCSTTTPYGQAAPAAPQVSAKGEALVLVHGFLSSAGGAFDGLWQPAGQQVQAALFKHYDGAVYAFDHPTLGAGPIANALALAKALPDGAVLHMLAHSRGGLVCELLSRAQYEQNGFRAVELDLFDKRQHDDAVRLRELIEVMHQKHLRVERLVRAGSPMRGTWLASNRLDRWLSLFYNVVRHAIPQGAQYVADTVFDVLAVVVKKRLEREHFPGIEAMGPTSPLAALLNDAPPELQQRLTVIAGDCVGTGFLHRLKVLITDGFFGEAHDLVVPTASMFGGAPRVGGTRYFFHQTPRVDHFHYFTQSESLSRIQTGLIGEDDQYAKLQRLERPVERPTLVPNRAVRPDAPLNIVLPGIMGTELAYRDKDRLWVDLGAFACGQFPKLELTADKHALPYPAPGTQDVFPMEPLADFYGDLMDALGRRDELVLAAGYDWRKPMSVAADALAAQLAVAWPKDSPRPLRLVAHSMGGLVARMMFVRHAELLARFERSARNRLLMLGTPNAGSLAIVRALLGDNKTIGWIALLAPQSERDLLSVAATFPGFHELLPQTGRMWEHASVWELLFEQHRIPPSKRPTLSAAAMALAAIGRKELRNSIVALPRHNTVYVAGFVDPLARDATVVDLDDKGQYVPGPGDGTVSYASGLIDGIPTYYAGAKHGDLPSFRKAFPAYFELLERGETALLPKEWKGLQDSRRGMQPDTLESVQLPYRPGREDLYRGLMGASPKAAQALNPSHADPITVHMVNGGLRFARYPLIVGHYQGDVMQGSEAELDRQFGGQMRRALELGVYPGPIETFQVFKRSQHTYDRRAPFAVIVGLGRPGEMSVGELRRTVKRGILGWFGTATSATTPSERRGAFSMVLLGSSVSGMTVRECVRAMLQGVQDAQDVIVQRLQASEGGDALRSIGDIELVEIYEDKALELAAELPRLLTTDEFRDHFRVAPRLEERDDLLRRLREESRSVTVVRRLDIRATGGRLRYSLPGIQAAVPVMKRDIDITEIDHYAREINEQLSTDRVLGRVLFNQLLPLELKRFALEQYQVLLTLNERAASLPWELADAGSKVPLSVQSGMIRQLRSTHYAPRERVSSNSALVIGEPVVEGLPPLPGARREAAAAADVLRSAGFEVTHLDQPSAVQVRDELGKRPYRIIHFAGHGMVDYQSPLSEPGATPRTGMVIGSLLVDPDRIPTGMAKTAASAPCGRGASNERGASEGGATGLPPPGLRHWLLLTPDDVQECVAQVPELVFINCCHLGRQKGIVRNAPKMARNFANSFMEIGCRAVVAAGWAVQDDAAQCFAEALYASMVRHGDNFIDAVRHAREVTFTRHSDSTPTWGAYQCYGDPNYSALRRGPVSRPAIFNTPRELLYWLYDRNTACMGLEGQQLEDIRRTVLETLAKEGAQWIRQDTVFLAAITTCEALGAFQTAADLISKRIRERRSVSPHVRAIHARICLRLAMLARTSDPGAMAGWRDEARIALDKLQATADLENSSALWFDLATFLRRWFILQDAPEAKYKALTRILEATRIAWHITASGIAARLDHSPNPDELVNETTDSEAQKTLVGIIIEHLLATRRPPSATPERLPDYQAMVRHCQAKLEQATTAVEFWDDTDQVDLMLLMLVAPPSPTNTAASQRTQEDYDREAGVIAQRYQFAMSLSATQAERDSISAHAQFWFGISTFFANEAVKAEREHWHKLQWAMARAKLPGVSPSTATPPAPAAKPRDMATKKAVKKASKKTAKKSTKKSAKKRSSSPQVSARKTAPGKTRGSRPRKKS